MSQVSKQPVGDAVLPATELVRGLRRMVGRSAARWKRLVVLEALGLTIAAPLAYLWLVFFIDNIFHLPVIGRLVANLGFIAALVYLVASLVRRWRQLHLTEDQVALAMESHTAGVQNRLINAIQLARDPATANSGDADFRRAVIDENYQKLQSLTLRQAAQSRPALIRIAAAFLVIIAGVLFWSLRPESFRNAVARIMLPLADVDPLYQTKLVVEPGDVEAAGDVTIRIHVNGVIPSELTVLHNSKSDRGSEAIRVASGSRDLRYTFKDVRQSTNYAVRGGDFVTQYYRISVPTPSTLSMIKVTYQFPAYTRLPNKETQSGGGDLEALIGTRAKVIFVFDQPAEQAMLHIQKVSPTTQPAADQTETLRKISPTEFAGEITFVDVESYQLETRQANHPPHLSPTYALRVRADQDPNLQLLGLNKQTEANVDAILQLKAVATDDIGLDKVGLFARRLTVPGASNAAAAPGAPGAPGASENQPDSWKQIEVWPADGALELHKDYKLSVAALGAIEGEKYEIALRGADTDPLKHGNWITGQGYVLIAGGEGVALQLLYEQILQSESDLKVLIASEQAAVDATGVWMQKLTPASGLRWDDKANLDALDAAMKAQAAEQEKIRQTAGRVAREMVEQAGNLRLSTGLLADTEMVRAIRILESVKQRDNPQAMRSAVADAKITDDRTITSLRDILDRYTKFRQDWELSNMTPFVKMLGDRQAVLRDESAKNVALAADPSGVARREAGARRESKIAALCGLSRVAFAGMAERVGDSEPIISKSFAAASASLGASELTNAMLEGAGHARAGRWAEAAKRQDVAAKALALIHQQLRAAQMKAAADALAALKERAKSDLAAQQALKKLQQGSLEFGSDFDEKKLKLEDIIHMREVAQGKAGAVDDSDRISAQESGTSDLGRLRNAGAKQVLANLSLATTPDAMPPHYPGNSDTATNKVTPPIQEKFDDLAGKLLDEAEKLTDKYDTYNLSLAAINADPGHVGKSAGDLDSTSATAATGNQKPPPANYGGVSREGLQGARAHGAVMGDQGVNRRGRDTPQEGQERAPDQAGLIHQAHSDDEQKDTSTGVGGKKVDAEHTNFSLADAGKWTDDMANRMGKPQDKNSIVERQGDKLDPRIAEMLRDLGSNQEQVIERLKSIKKDLTNLYLPTDQVDDLMAELTANLQSLRERPTADVFRKQIQTLDKLRSTVRVMGEAGTTFQPSLPREQAVHGPVLDDPARQTISGYEDAVKNYYEMLSAGQ